MVDHRGLAWTIARAASVAGATVAVATVAITVLESFAGVPNASNVYLVSVVATAVMVGTVGAVATALASVLVYNLLFTAPHFTLLVADPGEWLHLVVLLFVAVTVGQLAALQRTRAELAVAREREARALVEVSRALATRESTVGALPAIAALLQAHAGTERVWLALGPDDAGERIVADSSDGVVPGPPASYAVLRRRPGDGPAEWARIRSGRVRPAGRADGATRYRIRIEARNEILGSIWAVRNRHKGTPERSATRLLAAAADQIGQALAHDRLAVQAREAEVARRSDALKTALLESVSHDLRTPLAAIRAAAGTLMDRDVRLSPDEARASAAAIDRDVQRLNRVVTNLLDLGRIEGGALKPSQMPLDLDDAVTQAVGRIEGGADGSPVHVDVPSSAAVRADPVLLEEILLNVLDNAVRHTAPSTGIWVYARELRDEPFVRLTVEDAGEGVPAAAVSRLFEKFYRVPKRGAGSRPGTGIGLAVVKGLTEAMGGRVAARRSPRGGLAIEIDLPSAPIPAAVASA